MQRKINWVVDCDIHAFFDTVSRDWIVRFLEQRIADKRDAESFLQAVKGVRKL